MEWKSYLALSLPKSMDIAQCHSSTGKNNMEKFKGNDFSFYLTPEEFRILISKNLTSSREGRPPSFEKKQSPRKVSYP